MLLFNMAIERFIRHLHLLSYQIVIFCVDAYAHARARAIAALPPLPPLETSGGRCNNALGGRDGRDRDDWCWCWC